MLFTSVHILDSMYKCHYNVFMLQLLCVSNRGVTICPGHDTVRISILGSRYDTYHDILNKI